MALVGEELNDAQLMGFVVIICVSSSLSILGSSRVWLFQKQTRNGATASTVYHHLMRGLSIADLIFSLTCLAQPFLIDADQTVIPTASGTKLTCGIVGFVFIWSLLVCAMHNGILSLQFWLVVVRGWTHSHLQKHFEGPAQLVAWLWPLVIPIVAFAGDNWGPQSVSMVCSIGPARLTTLLFLGTQLVSVVVSIVSTVWVYAVYRRKVTDTRRRSALNLGATSSKLESPTTAKRVQALARRAVGYTCVYLNTLLWPLLVVIITGSTNLEEDNTNGKGLVYVVRVLSWIFLPLQGFFNLLIYVQPLVDQRHKAAIASGNLDDSIPSKFMVFLRIVVLCGSDVEGSQQWFNGTSKSFIKPADNSSLNSSNNLERTDDLWVDDGEHDLHSDEENVCETGLG